MKISGNDIRPGNVIEYDSSLWVAVKTNKVKPGKGPAYNQVELKNIIDGRKLNNRFGSDERVERARIENKDFQYLYKDGDQLVFMNNDTYEQINLAEEFVGERAAFLQDGILAVSETEPHIKGQTASSSYKPAMMENGVRVMVPPFIAVGERIVVDTSEIAYVRRAE
jgi:elongation factor P